MMLDQELLGEDEMLEFASSCGVLWKRNARLQGNVWARCIFILWEDDFCVLRV